MGRGPTTRGRSADPSRAALARHRFAAVSAPLCLLVLLACAALAAATTTSAQEPPDCDDASGVDTTDGCPPRASEPEPPPGPAPPPEDPPAPQPEPAPSAPAAPDPAPQQPAGPEPSADGSEPACADGTLPPCSDDSRSPARSGGQVNSPLPPARRQGRADRPEADRGDSPARAKARRRGSKPERRRDKAQARCRDALAAPSIPGVVPIGCEDPDGLGAEIVAGRPPSRPLPDPLPPGSRLDVDFARLLQSVAGDQWPLVLAVLRAEGRTGPAPAGAAELRELARRVRGGAADERVLALADYHRAVGLEGLSRGLDAVKGDLIERVMTSPGISLYAGGRFDVGAGRIDTRVLVVMLYLAERHDGITVSSLLSGHGIFTTSGGVSLHSYGRAVDIGSVGGVSVLGNQQPGGITEKALRSVMLLPAELRPSELISLFELGGPSFAMADHADHIHIGF